jgi:tetratricopeptide (TPR) repeat protein
MKPSAAEQIRSGHALLKQGQKRAAVAHFQALRSEYPRNAQVWLQSAFVLDRLGREGEAIPLYERALSLGLRGADERDALVGLASSLRNVGRAADGLEHLRRTLRRFRADVIVELFTALLLSDVGRAGEAARLLALAILRDSSAPDLGRYRDVLRRKFARTLPAMAPSSGAASSGPDNLAAKGRGRTAGA